MTTLAEQIKIADQKKKNGAWIPGTGETPFRTRTGARLLYCWQPSTGDKAYLDVDSDLILTDEEARNLLAVW